jgi:hypothetical protein
MTLDAATIDKIAGRTLERLLSLLGDAVEQSAIDEPEYMRPVDAEKKFGLKEAHIRALVRTGRVEGKQGKGSLVKTSSLRAFIKNQQ